MQSLKLIIDKLLTENCLLLGQDSKFTSRKVARYLLGTRNTTEIFKLYELRYLLLKIYPLIHNLFNNPQINPRLKSQTLWNSIHKQRKKFLLFKNQSSFIVKRRNIPPQILFASVTPAFSDIIYKASQICNMPLHKNRWLSGSITAAIAYPADKFGWQYLQDLTQKKISQAAFRQWKRNKENEEKIKEKTNYYNRSRWPSLLVIPDISNNTMILKEAQTVGLPVIGLVNSNCPAEIEYPIFAQDQTLQSVHFFCHFLALLIAKEAVFIQHKRYTLQKASSKSYVSKKLLKTTTEVFSAPNKKLFSRRKKKFRLNIGLEFQKIKKPWKKPFFFNVVLPWQQNNSKRYFLELKLRKYYPFLSTNTYHYRQQRRRKRFLYKNITYFIKQVKRNRTKTLKNKPRIKPRNKILAFKKISRFVIFQKNFSKKQSKYLDSSFLIEKKLFYNEYKKKYFQKNKQTTEEKKEIRHKLRTFLWFPKMINRWTLHHRFFPQPPQFLTTPYFFKTSLQQWSQNFKWKNYRYFIQGLLGLKLKKNNEDNYSLSEEEYKHKYKHRMPHDKNKGYLHKSRDKNKKYKPHNQNKENIHRSRDKNKEYKPHNQNKENMQRPKDQNKENMQRPKDQNKENIQRSKDQSKEFTDKPKDQNKENMQRPKDQNKENIQRSKDQKKEYKPHNQNKENIHRSRDQNKGYLHRSKRKNKEYKPHNQNKENIQRPKDQNKEYKPKDQNKENIQRSKDQSKEFTDKPKDQNKENIQRSKDKNKKYKPHNQNKEYKRQNRF